MDREILFRGKDIISGEWITGFLVDGKHIGCWVEANPVRPETVGQFTGLTDKNGKKIFEGDILVIWNEYEHPVLVKFLDFGWHCVIPNVNVYIHYRHRLENNTAKYEVIGNIWDNPELMEGGVENE